MKAPVGSATSSCGVPLPPWCGGQRQGQEPWSFPEAVEPCGIFVYLALDLVCVLERSGERVPHSVPGLKVDLLNLCFQLKLIPGPLKPEVGCLSSGVRPMGFVPLGLGSNAAHTSFAHHRPYLPFFFFNGVRVLLCRPD